jgi:hypothetical protein
MVGKLKGGKIVYDNPYSMYNFDILFANEHGQQKISKTIEYEVHNPRKIVLEEGANYEFEVIYFEDGSVAEVFDKVQTEEVEV